MRILPFVLILALAGCSAPDPDAPQKVADVYSQVVEDAFAIDPQAAGDLFDDPRFTVTNLTDRDKIDLITVMKQVAYTPAQSIDDRRLNLNERGTYYSQLLAMPLYAQVTGEVTATLDPDAVVVDGDEARAPLSAVTVFVDGEKVDTPPTPLTSGDGVSFRFDGQWKVVAFNVSAPPA